jgi:hypothetical protein
VGVLIFVLIFELIVVHRGLVPDRGHAPRWRR